MKRRRIMVDITNPAAPFVHKGGRRKGRRYLAFYVMTNITWKNWEMWYPETFHVQGHRTRAKSLFV